MIMVLFATEATVNSPCTIVNNIIDFTNLNAATAGHYREAKIYI